VKNASQLNLWAAPAANALLPARPPAETAGRNGRNGYHMKGYYRTMSGFGEAVRTLRNTILLSDLESPLRSLLITSASPGDGKTTAAAHLAIAHAEQGRRTLLVDGDMRRPSIHRKFGLTGSSGLTNVLMGELDWKETVVHIDGQPNLDILPAGPPSHRASDLIGPRMGDLLDEFTRDYELVILDTPPLLGFAEPLQMATLVQGVLVISRAGETKRKAVSSVLAALTRLRANILGVVLNHMKHDTSDGYSYYGYYGGGYEDKNGH